MKDPLGVSPSKGNQGYAAQHLYVLLLSLNYHHTTTDTNERLAGANTKLYW